ADPHGTGRRVPRGPAGRVLCPPDGAVRQAGHVPHLRPGLVPAAVPHIPPSLAAGDSRMSDHIDPVQYGRLLQAMEHLSEQVPALTAQLASVQERLAEVENRYRLGKWGLGGLVLGVGFAVFGLKETVAMLWKALT